MIYKIQSEWVTKVSLVAIVLIFGSIDLLGQTETKKIDSLKRILLHKIPDSTRIITYDLLSKNYYPEKLDSSKVYAEKLNALSERKSSDLGKAKYHKRIGNIEIYLGKYELAQKSYEKGLAYAKKSKDKYAIATITVNLVINAIKMVEPENAIAIGLPLLDYMRDNEISDRYKSIATRWIGDAYLMLEKKKKAIDFYNKAIEFKRKPEEKVTLYVNNAIMLCNTADYENTLKFLYPVLEIIEKQNIENIYSILAYKTLGGVYNKMEMYEKALESYDMAYEISMKTGIDTPIENTIYHKGMMLQKLNRHLEAREAFLSALEIARKEKNLPNANTCLNALGYSYLRENNYSEALYYLKEAVTVAEEQKDNVLVIDSYTSLGQGYLEANNIPEAKKAFEKGRDVFSKAKYISPVIESMSVYHQSMAFIDSVEGNYYKSLYHYKKYIAIKDSSNTLKVKQTIANLEMAFETEKKDKEIKVLSANNEIQKLKVEKEKNIRMVLGSAGILALLFLGITYNKYRTKKNALAIISEQKMDIEEKNNENKLLIKEIHHRVKNNLQIILSLLSSGTNKSEKDTETTQVILESKNRIKSMALIHQKLYSTNNFIKVNSVDYFKDLIAHIKHSYSDDISFETNIENSEIKMDLAVPLGLIVNELITNAYKYAFEGEQEARVVTINFSNSPQSDMYKLEVIDNGNGLPENFNIQLSESFGLQMVSGLVDQLQGRLNYSNNNGAGFEIYLKDLTTA
ncbi:hypothetical protein MTsPCn5_18530 [Croceitalea sp. MTPC5]|uniref:tetratricopeptide repeat protein n=1 Tax=Croceitalea sp. MTPC5 TaxID=3056565 RepID=UPI002B3E57BC|nr:hypothetical protein MTsPCn5_18530 [Croceitalea sp. MTPC5]